MTTPSTNQHAGGGPPATPPPPEPPFAEQARTLMHLGRTGMLSTQLHRRRGFPFGSLGPYGLDALGRPTFLISTMAVHTQNLLADPHASLLVTQPGWKEDPLAGARLTLVGAVAALPAGEREAIRADYLARHENARFWVDFDDFAFYRMEVEELYYVAGFGAMGWVDAAAYRGASPDPLADHAAGILEHMNADHGDALVLYSKVLGGIDAEAATMTGIDRLGFRVRVRSGDRLQGLRLNFPREVRTPQEARTVLVEMVRDARQRNA
jgi:putative heme iron utilization protein